MDNAVDSVCVVRPRARAGTRIFQTSPAYQAAKLKNPAPQLADTQTIPLWIPDRGDGLCLAAAHHCILVGPMPIDTDAVNAEDPPYSLAGAPPFSDRDPG